jgi:hypothetical protein
VICAVAARPSALLWLAQLHRSALQSSLLGPQASIMHHNKQQTNKGARNK